MRVAATVLWCPSAVGPIPRLRRRGLVVPRTGQRCRIRGIRPRQPNAGVPPNHDFSARGRRSHSHYFLVRIASKFLARISPTTMEFVLLGRLFGECRNLLFGLSLVLQKGHHSRMIFQRVSWSSMFAVPWLVKLRHLWPPARVTGHAARPPTRSNNQASDDLWLEHVRRLLRE